MKKKLRLGLQLITTAATSALNGVINKADEDGLTYEPPSKILEMEHEDEKVRAWLKEFHAARDRGEDPSPIYVK